MTVGLCMDIVKIGLAMHLRYIRPCTTRTDGQTELQPEPLRGGSVIVPWVSRCMGFVPRGSCMSSQGRSQKEDLQLHKTKNPIHLTCTCRNHGTDDLCHST